MKFLLLKTSVLVSSGVFFFWLFLLIGYIQVSMASIYENDPLWAEPLKWIPLKEEAVKSNLRKRQQG